MIVLLMISAGTYFLYTKGRLNIIRMGFGIIAAAATLGFAGYKIFAGAYGLRMWELIYGLKGEQSGDTSFDTRSGMISRGLDLWVSSPLFGHGNEGFRVMSGFGGYSHSTPIELLVNYGVIGLICYYLFYVLLIRKLLPMLRSQSDYVRVYGFWILLSLACILFWSAAAVCYYEKPIAMLLAALAGLTHHYLSYSGREQAMWH
jgi:O-antigen ligase